MPYFPFKRLKEKFGESYKGGILLIDEIESSLHPAAQRILIRRLYKYSKDYKIQFIFTTHSPTVIKSLFLDKNNTNSTKLVYLKRISNIVKTYNEVDEHDIERVISELNGEVYNAPVKKMKIRLFCEDEVASSFIKTLLKVFKKKSGNSKMFSWSRKLS